jgi:hypothetical protein
MIDRREEKVHQIYLHVLKRAMEALRAGLHRELDFFNELEHIIRTEFADSRKLILTSPAKEQIVVKKTQKRYRRDFNNGTSIMKMIPTRYLPLMRSIF